MRKVSQDFKVAGWKAECTKYSSMVSALLKPRHLSVLSLNNVTCNDFLFRNLACSLRVRHHCGVHAFSLDCDHSLPKYSASSFPSTASNGGSEIADTKNRVLYISL